MRADPSNTRVETERLILRTLELEDFDEYAQMYADPDVMQFLAADGKPMSRIDAWFSFSRHVGHWYLRGFGMFAVVDRATEHVIGRIGPWMPEGWPGFEIGWSLRREYWGRGYATEAVKACMTYSFEKLGQTHVISLIDPENLRSIRVAERVGERLEGEVALPHQPNKTVLQYGIKREDWAG